MNYRCPADIVRAAATLLTYNRVRVPKTIRAAKPEGPPARSTERRPPEQLPRAAVARVQEWLDAGARPSEIAVLTRVRALLLGPQLLCAQAGIPANAPIGAEALERTGTRTGLAYLRLAQGAADDAMSGPDLATAARRPSRSLRREVLQRIAGRRQWRRSGLRSLAEGTTGRLDEFLDDLDMLGAEYRAGADTEMLLRFVRDRIGLGGALDTLDRGGRGPEASHRDDLNALISVAALAPDVAGFEPWLRNALERRRVDATADEVTLSTVHRVKGMEWPYVVVLGVHDGLMPHHLADDVEEERRIFHVALTRADTAAHLIAETDSRTRFLDELDGAAPMQPDPPPRREPAIKAGRAAVAPADEPLVDALKAWRRDRAKADGVPPYVVLHDNHLEGIAAERPTSLVRLARCPGIGPTKLERYGDEIIAVVADCADRPDRADPKG